MYTPTRLGYVAPGINAATFRYMAYYTPQPPHLAAPDIRNCPVPGQCPITRTDAFSFNGQTDGVISVGGGSQKSTLRFYAWAAHNQMPLRQVVIDWGDSNKQRVDDTRMKNRKPFCGVQRECSLVPGLTCQTNADCPAGTGTCAALGTCAQNQNLTCSQDSDCSTGGIKDTCTIRTMFGNSTEACQSDYFDYAHLYTCGAVEKETLPSCTREMAAGASRGTCSFGTLTAGLISSIGVLPTACFTVDDCIGPVYGISTPSATERAQISCTGATADPYTGRTILARCSRDTNRACRLADATGAITEPACAPGDSCIEGLAPVNGCFDTDFRTCRFTPRVMIQDNFGWCTGECRASTTGGQPSDITSGDGAVTVRHPNGGCWAGSTLGSDPNIRFNTSAGGGDTVLNNGIDNQYQECLEKNPIESRNDNNRPWVVYPGSLQLRESGELVR